MKENRKRVVLLSVIGIATLLVAIIGATFAYFTTTLTTTPQSGTITTARVGDVTATVVNNAKSDELIYPGWSGSGSTTVYFNTASDVDTNYTCKINVSTFDEGLDNVYIQTSGADGQKNTEFEITQTGDITLASGTLAASSTLSDGAYGLKHIVEFTVRYKETGSGQNAEEGKHFAATVSCSLAGNTIYYNSENPNGTVTEPTQQGGNQQAEANEAAAHALIVSQILQDNGYVNGDAVPQRTSNGITGISAEAADKYLKATPLNKVGDKTPNVIKTTAGAFDDTYTSYDYTFFRTNNAENGDRVYYYAGNATNNWVKFGKVTVEKPVYVAKRDLISPQAMASTRDGVFYDSLSDCMAGVTYKRWENDSNTTNLGCVNIGAHVGDDMYWRIIRTNEISTGGGLRLLYAGSGTPGNNNAFITTLRGYNDSDNDKMYVGYMYGTSGLVENHRTNQVNKSSIASTIENWYNITFNNSNDNNTKDVNGTLLTNYINPKAIYCNDRSAYSLETDDLETYGYTEVDGSEVWDVVETKTIIENINYGGYGRLVENKAPSYACGATAEGYGHYYDGEQSDADKFTGTNADGIGNQLLGNTPAALITADELAFAGGAYQTYGTPWTDRNAGADTSSINDISAHFGVGGGGIWTMTPAYNLQIFSTTNYSIEQLNVYPYYDFYNYMVRPVISLKANVQMTGTGTPNDPYIVLPLNS